MDEFHLTGSPDSSSLILLCDSDLGEKTDEDDEEGGIVDTNVAFLHINGGWADELFLQDIRDELRGEGDHEFPIISQFLDSRNAFVSVLMNSRGGLSSIEEDIIELLRLGKNRDWHTQAIVGGQACSAAAQVVIAAQQMYMPRNARIAFHYGVSTNEEVGSSSQLVDNSLYESLSRMRRLSSDAVSFNRSVVEKRFREVLDRPNVTTDDWITFTGEELQQANVARGITFNELSHAVDEARLPEDHQYELDAFLRAAKAHQ